MHNLGISIYPEHSTFEKDAAYMELAAKYGFKRIFTCLLSVTKSKEEIVEEFTRFVGKAHELGFIVSADTNPEVFAHLGATPEDLSIFHEIGIDIIRLDGHFDDRLDVIITRNPYGIKIEFNGSSDANVDGLIAHGADKNNLCICHNFYPETYTGLSLECFNRFNKKWMELGLHTAAFINSQQENTYGPWPVFDGLCTLEMYRNLPVSTQARHLIATECIDDILFGNAYASEEEFKILSEIDLTKTTVRVDICPEASEEEIGILYNYNHVGRDDHSEYFIRSSYPRLDFGKKSIPYRNPNKPMFERGDVVCVNDNLARYRGELEVILKPIPNDGNRNLIGTIPAEELIILDEMEKHHDHLFGFVKEK
ncbi:MAG: MupG family TIM beta-alpha barrel fold protein [Bacillota bacterium]|nr:MupG family TIM beta-alpha barrel fold protein [Bacillota bacterium]